MNTNRRFRLPSALLLEPLEPRLLRCGDISIDPPIDDSGSDTQPVDTQPSSTQPTDTQPSDTQPSDGGSDTQPTDNSSTDNSSSTDDDSTTDVLFPPDAPKHFAAQNPSPTSVFLSWSQPSDDADYFQISRRDPNGHSHTIATPDGDDTSYVDATVLPGRTYTYSITAFNDAGSSDPTSTHISIPAITDQTLVGIFGHIPGATTSAPITFFDTDGTQTTLTLSGPGTGTLRLTPAGYTLALTSTTTQSTVNIATTKTHTRTDDGRFSLSTLTDRSSLNSLTAATTDLSGPAQLTTASTLTLGNLNHAALTATTINAIHFGSVINTTLTTTGPITTLSAQRWLTGAITTTALTTLNITENFSANLILRGSPKSKLTLTSATIHGQITGGTWSIAGSANSISTRSLLHLWTLTLTKGTLNTLNLLDPTATLANLHLTANSIHTLLIAGKKLPAPKPHPAK